jgi:hypothetical protein
MGGIRKHLTYTSHMISFNLLFPVMNQNSFLNQSECKLSFLNNTSYFGTIHVEMNSIN